MTPTAEAFQGAAAAPILILDSGVGGLSVLAAVRAQLPRAPLVYAMDSAGYPYGIRSEVEIDARVPALVEALVARYAPRLVIVACNTASTIALDTIRARLAIPVVGTVPAIKPAAAISRSRVIGVLGTCATVRQAYVDRLAREFAADCVLLRHGAPELVAFAEAQLCGDPADPAVPARALAGLTGQPHGERLDTVALACTHFPLVRDALRAACVQPITFVDGNAGIARRTAALLHDQPWPQRAPPGIAVCTRLEPRIRRLEPALARFGLDRLETLAMP